MRSFNLLVMPDKMLSDRMFVQSEFFSVFLSSRSLWCHLDKIDVIQERRKEKIA